MRGLEQSSLVGQGPREGALHVAEQFALQERLGQGATIDGHERPIGPGGGGVNGAGDQFFSGAGLPLDEHRAPGRGDARHHLVDFHHPFGGAHDVLHPASPSRLLQGAEIVVGGPMVLRRPVGRNPGPFLAARLLMEASSLSCLALMSVSTDRRCGMITSSPVKQTFASSGHRPQPPRPPARRDAMGSPPRAETGARPASPGAREHGGDLHQIRKTHTVFRTSSSRRTARMIRERTARRSRTSGAAA